MKKGKKWYKSVGNWITIVACIILVPILLANLFIIFQSHTNNDKVPSVFGYKPFIVLSGSMEGQILKGDLIITKEVDPSTLKVEDIIAFRDVENTVTTHRIIDIVKSNGTTKFITKGDNNSTQDRSLVDYKDVEGIYVMRIAGFGSIMKSLSEPMTIIILVFIITLGFVIGFVLSVQKDKKKEQEEFLKYKLMKENQDLKNHQVEEKRVEEKNDDLTDMETNKQEMKPEVIQPVNKLAEQEKVETQDEELEELRRMRTQQQENEELERLRKLKEQQERELEELKKQREQEQTQSLDQELEELRKFKLKQEINQKVTEILRSGLPKEEVLRQLRQLQQDSGISNDEFLELLRARRQSQ